MSGKIVLRQAYKWREIARARKARMQVATMELDAFLRYYWTSCFGRDKNPDQPLYGWERHRILAAMAVLKGRRVDSVRKDYADAGWAKGYWQRTREARKEGRE